MGEQVPWKVKRTKIVEHIIRDNFHDYDVPPIPTNAVRSHQRKYFTDLEFDQREIVLFEDFLSVCRGINGPFIQCIQSDNKIHWLWGQDMAKQSDTQKFERWLADCFEMATTLFILLIDITRLRDDRTRGPTVYAFCSLVVRYLEKAVYEELRKFDHLEVKSLLTLQRACKDLNWRLLRPLHEIAKEIDLNDKVGGELINFLFEQKGRPECSHIKSILDEIISAALLRYNQTIYEWISQCSLSMDMAHEFFIWDLRKQNVVKRNEFAWDEYGLKRKQFERLTERDELGFKDTFVCIPELLPNEYQSVFNELVNLGSYLFTMKRQGADMEHLSAQYLLDISEFKDKTLSEFCAAIRIIYNKCSVNILNHFNQRFDIVHFAKHLPYFFVGINSAWIYEFVVLLEDNEISEQVLDKECEEGEREQFNAQLQQSLEEAFRVSRLQNCPFHDKITVKLTRRLDGDQKLTQFEQKNSRKSGTPKLVLNVVEPNVSRNWNTANNSGVSALSLAFPAQVMWSYRQIFFHLLLLNRAKYLVSCKYYALKGKNECREEFAAVHQFLRMLNVYIEYICGIASDAYPKFSKELDSVQTLDKLVDVQVKFIHELMGQMMLDQNFVDLKKQFEKLSAKYCAYARDSIDFHTLNVEASPLVGDIKKFLLQNGRSVRPLKDLLFGCYFKAIGDTAADEEPIWRLLYHVDDETAFGQL